MKFGLRALILLSLTAVLGCGGGPKLPKWPDPVPASGTITFDGKPLVDATVSFTPLEQTQGKGAVGTTDESGKYELKSLGPDGKPKPGAIPGKYRVSVSRMVKADGSVWKPDPKNPGGPMNFGAKEELPRQYAVESKLVADVASGKSPYDFKLEKRKK
ncbi:carboxypeptidase-like regulatory domain-containing protein [Schlesneria sp. DSM 10557]|uniref:carboxypeptidase-like regulatory domain-containing protein n=1 Tax=Schlesneria sp. DSM 10557 TaxID=3044399 RepID=UPI0035A115A5